MGKPLEIRNVDGTILQNLKNLLPNIAEKSHDYYADVYKERMVDYPMAVLSALIRISLYQGSLRGNYDKKMKTI